MANWTPIVMVTPILFLLILIEIVFERLQNHPSYELNNTTSNIGCGITEQLSVFISGGLSFVLYAVFFEHFRLFTIPTTWYWTIILFLGVDLAYYWGHRKCHEINIFWAAHVVHHQSTTFNLSVGLRHSIFQKFCTMSFYWPLAFLGFDVALFIICNSANALYQFWIHSSNIGKLGWVEWFLNTPSHHRVHHGTEEKYLDKNHGGVFIIWDKLFGTFQVEEETPTYGILAPFNSWNPLYAQFATFQQIHHDLKTVDGWKNKLRLLFAPPGTFPSTFSSKQPHKKQKATPQNQALNRYLLIQFLVIITSSFFFLLYAQQFTIIEQWMIILTIISSAAILGLILDGRRWALTAEYVRIIWISTLLIILFESWEISLVLFPIMGVIMMLYYIWLINIPKHQSTTF